MWSKWVLETIVKATLRIFRITLLEVISKGYLNFSTELSSQIFDCCPRKFLIQEERIGNVVSTSESNL